MSFIPQWNQYTAYAVGSVVQLNLTTYICILATPPSATPPASAPSVWSVTSTTLPKGKVGFSQLTWTPDASPSPSYSAAVSVSPLLLASSQVSATIQLGQNAVASDVVLASNAWLISAQPSPTTETAGQIVFYVSNSGDPRPVNDVLIEWSVIAF